MIKIVYKPSFLRQYDKLPQRLRQETEEKIELFRADQRHSFLKTHKLKGRLRKYFSFYVNYRYRIVFEYEAKNRVALVWIGDHDVYDIL